MRGVGGKQIREHHIIGWATCTWLALGAALLTAYPLSAQIQNPVGGFQEVHPRRGMRLFVGEFRFEPLPSPLDTSTVLFTLRVVQPIQRYESDGDWTLRLDYFSKVVSIIGDSTFEWPAPHAMGDEYTGSFRIVPLVGGLQAITLREQSDKLNGLSVNWLIDNAGQLQFLGKQEDQPIAQYTMHGPTFFDEKLVRVVEIEGQSDKPFRYEVEVVPPFRIGSTSTVKYRLTALRDMAEGVTGAFSANHFDVVSSPPILNRPIRQGEVCEAQVVVIPHAVRNVHNLKYSVLLGKGQPFYSVSLDALFHDDGSLWLIGDWGVNSVAPKDWPSAFKLVDDTSQSTFWIYPDGTVHSRNRGSGRQ